RGAARGVLGATEGVAIDALRLQVREAQRPPVARHERRGHVLEGWHGRTTAEDAQAASLWTLHTQGRDDPVIRQNECRRGDVEARLCPWSAVELAGCESRIARCGRLERRAVGRAPGHFERRLR